MRSLAHVAAESGARSGEFSVTQNRSPAGSTRTCQPTTPRPDIDGAETDQALHLALQVVGTHVQVRPYRTAGLVESLEQQLQRRTGIVVPLACELSALGNPPTCRKVPARQKATSAS